MVKIFYTAIFFFSIPGFVDAQQINKLDLQQAYELAQKNYPVIKQRGLLQQTAAINMDNLQKNFSPQVSLGGQASYQSDVTKIPVAIPGFNIPSASKDQYKIFADVNQLVYDGGITKEQKQFQQLNASVEEQKVEVELYKLKDRINQVFLGAMYLDAQMKQVELVKADIQTGIKRVDAQVQNGVAFRSNLNMLKAELLKNDQRLIELKASKKGLLDVLALLTGQPLADNVQLEIANSVSEKTGNEIGRPELKLFSEQEKLIAQQDKLITAKNLPKANLFVQSGYGRPGLNMLKNDFDFYYIGGLKFNWSLGNLYTKKKEKELVEINKKMLETQKETFLLNTNAQLTQQNAEIVKLNQLIAADNEIISLRASVKDAAKAQLENGVITANDYLKEVNAEDQARQALITHQLQLIQANINYNTISGK